MSDGYERLAHISDGDATLAASYSANNGIRIDILDPELSADWACFEFTDDQAEAVGNALLRWARARKA